MTPERELRESFDTWWMADQLSDDYEDFDIHQLARIAGIAKRAFAAGTAAPAPTPSWLPSAKRLEGQFNELLEAMYEELNPGPTGGNDYHDAWQIFGEQLTVAHEVISALKELPAPTPAPPTRLAPLWSGDAPGSTCEPVVPEREPLSMAAIACIEKLAKRDLSDSNASYRAGYRDCCRHVIEESGLLTVLAAAPRAAGGQRLTGEQVRKVLRRHNGAIWGLADDDYLQQVADDLNVAAAEPQMEEGGKT